MTALPNQGVFDFLVYHFIQGGHVQLLKFGLDVCEQLGRNLKLVANCY